MRTFRSDRKRPAPAPPPDAVTQLAAARRRQGQRQADVAEAMGSAQGRLAEWETGDHIPQLTTVVRWAKVLGYRLAIVREEDANG